MKKGNPAPDRIPLFQFPNHMGSVLIERRKHRVPPTVHAEGIWKRRPNRCTGVALASMDGTDGSNNFRVSIHLGDEAQRAISERSLEDTPVHFTRPHQYPHPWIAFANPRQGG